MSSLHLKKYDVCVIGGGYMGSAVALGLVNLGARVLVADKISNIQKASKANFGLVWSQSKGINHRPYSLWSQNAVRATRDFVKSLEEESTIDVELRLGKGMIACLGDKELEEKTQVIKRLHRAAASHGEEHPSQMLDHKEVQELVGKIPLGEAVTGASFSPIDGDLNPLLFLKAMRKVFQKKGGIFAHGCTVQAIEKNKENFVLATTQGKIEAPRIVMAAGHGNVDLAAMLDPNNPPEIPIVPEKGQLLVTERVKPFLSFPMSGLRQTECGTVMIGTTQEDTGFDVSTTVSVAARLSNRAIQIFPSLSNTRIVRSWGGLRVLTSDGLPIYDEIKGHPNAFVLATHSCVTLASLHFSLLPPWIMGKEKPKEIQPFNLERFHV
ncbi:MAG: FAD-binding oxidoreductase [Desulfobacteraceae bacterium]|nr:FAD-binding oxidoreductase [Desulfobacteraceae bacterium]